MFIFNFTLYFLNSLPVTSDYKVTNAKNDIIVGYYTIISLYYLRKVRVEKHNPITYKILGTA